MPARLARLLAVTLVFAATATFATPAHADDFATGSFIIPMDTTYQDVGMLKGYGLVYQLLLADIPVRWCIKPNKNPGEADFTASATDVETNAIITNHGYRGGPFVIDSADRAQASAIVTTWQTSHTTAVHEATAPFSCDVSRLLVTAPNIAMMADGNQKVARGYMEAAGIPDSVGDYTWPDTSPDMLDPTEVTGPSDTDHSDGALFDADGTPKYCQFMSMHWKISEAVNNPGVVAEVREFLNYPTHFFAECQAVNAFENHPNGRFLTPNGFNIANEPRDVDLYHADEPFAQMDGAFETVGGSEPAYSLPPGDAYKATDITMITGSGTPEGTQDVWMTGYLDGVCPPEVEVCTQFNFGKISYLGGHEYEVKTPISANPDSQGTRLFLNSLFEAPCATAAGQPDIQILKFAPSQTATDTVTYTIELENFGTGIAQSVVVSDTLPAGSTFVSSIPAPTTQNGNDLEWNVGSLTAQEVEAVEVTVRFGSEASFENTATADYTVGVSTRSVTSNTVSTTYCAPETDAELCTAAGAECGQISVSDKCGTPRNVACDAVSCDADATCDATNQCVCDAGYTGDGLSCVDVDECGDGTNNCDLNATCTNTPGGFTCACNAGFTGDGTSCVPLDACSNGTSNCDANATCSASGPNTFSCTCNAGYTGDGVTCLDDDECAAGTDNCALNAACTNTGGGFICACNAGYVGDGTTCTDVDECSTGADNCDANATCTNQPGGFTCQCNVGYSGNGQTCVLDPNECTNGVANCDPNAICTDTMAGFDCTCAAGFSGNGVTCTDDDECAAGTDNCNANATCTNTTGSFTCACAPGYTGNGITCTDADECASGTDNCDANATCANTSGGFTCTCNAGYQGDGTTCTTNPDECADGTDNCDANSTCTDTPGGFDCACNAGFTGDGTTCSDVDECAGAADNCADNATCTNTVGGFDCECADGFTGDGTTCDDIDECQTRTADCGTDGTCINTDGGFVCDCADGFTHDGTTCADVDECLAGLSTCDANATCTNTAGGFTCACKPGYQGDGESCVSEQCACASDQTCVGGTCFDSCNEDADCTAVNELCYDNRCTDDPCRGVSCGDEKVCAGGTCFDRCIENDDCSNPGDFCFDGRCSQTSCGGISCGSEQTCWGGSCFNTCGEDVDCDNANDRCYGTRCTDEACTNVACAAGQVCWGGSCFDSCDGDVDCTNPGDRCYEGRCTDEACRGVQCPNVQTCWGGSCFDTCGEDVSCESADDTCYETRCATDPCAGVQCPSEQSCIQGYCRSACMDDSECGDGEVCSMGLCGSATPGEEQPGPNTGGGREEEGCGCASAQDGANHVWLSVLLLGLFRVRRRSR